MNGDEQRRIETWKGGRLAGHANGRSQAWRTITFAVPPSDYALLSAIVTRDKTKFSTLAREAVQAYLLELEAQ